MLKQLTGVLIFIAVALLHYLEIVALVDVFTFLASAILLCSCLFVVFLSMYIKEGVTLKKKDYDAATREIPLHIKIFNWVVTKPVIIGTLIYIEASVTLGLFLITWFLSEGIKKHFKSFEWSDDGYCIRKLDKEEK